MIPNIDGDTQTDDSGPKRICVTDDCGRKHYARGWCKNHYTQFHDRERILARTRYQLRNVESGTQRSY